MGDRLTWWDTYILPSSGAIEKKKTWCMSWQQCCRKDDKLKGIYDTDSMAGTVLRVTITSISEEEAVEIRLKA